MERKDYAFAKSELDRVQAERISAEIEAEKQR